MSQVTHVSFTPATEGIDHVNIYSRSRTPQGRLLSNFAATPFTLYGIRFATVEGFYQGMLFDDEQERLRIAGLSGSAAKRLQKKAGRKAGDPVRTWDGRTIPYRAEEFDEEVRKAIRQKVRENPEVAAALLGTGDLPLTHYYVMWGRPIQPRGESGLLENVLSELREELRRQAAKPAEGSLG
jgi:predicted NAD-dependent protein-ADP-ribosyltransferase YbiA (DUF1768 family)